MDIYNTADGYLQPRPLATGVARTRAEAYERDWRESMHGAYEEGLRVGRDLTTLAALARCADAYMDGR